MSVKKIKYVISSNIDINNNIYKNYLFLDV